MIKLTMGIALICFATAIPNQAQGTSPLSQAEYETMMGCIGKFEGTHSLLVHLTTQFEDKAWSNKNILKGNKIKLGMDLQRFKALDSAYGLDIKKGQSIRAASQIPFQNLITSGTPVKQWKYYQENGAITPSCKTNLNNTAVVLFR